ncbi:hypothetical protein D3C80_1110920 [compost metagenome]
MGFPCLAFLTKEKTGNVEGFKEWYKSHYQSLVSSTDYEGLSYQIKYNPTELRLLGAIDRKEVNNKGEIKQWYKENDTYEEFAFRITSKSGRDLFVEYCSISSNPQNMIFCL